jgi:hypothetical protein
VKLRFLLTGLVLTVLFGAVPDGYESARRKIDDISSDRLKPGTRVDFSPAELEAYARHEMPDGVRNPRLKLLGNEMVVGSALIDFGKVRRAQGHPPGWLMSKLLDGERPVTVTARLHSANGQARVDVQSVDVSGIVIDGQTLDFLIQNFLLPAYPDAAVGRPFALSHGIDRFDVQPANVAVLLKQGSEAMRR